MYIRVQSTAFLPNIFNLWLWIKMIKNRKIFEVNAKLTAKVTIKAAT